VSQEGRAGLVPLFQGNRGDILEPPICSQGGFDALPLSWNLSVSTRLSGQKRPEIMCGKLIRSVLVFPYICTAWCGAFSTSLLVLSLPVRPATSASCRHSNGNIRARGGEALVMKKIIFIDRIKQNVGLDFFEELSDIECSRHIRTPTP